jgi:hypothetical protein
VPDARWRVLEDAKPLIRERLRDSGVAEVRLVAAYPGQQGALVWLCTEHDHQRDALGHSEPHRVAVIDVLRQLGFPETELQTVHTTAQSQETVDRDFEGSWFYAMR